MSDEHEGLKSGRPKRCAEVVIVEPARGLGRGGEAVICRTPIGEHVIARVVALAREQQVPIGEVIAKALESKFGGGT